MKLSLYFKEFYLTPEFSFDNEVHVNPFKPRLSNAKIGKHLRFLCFHLRYLAKPPPVKQIDLEAIDRELELAYPDEYKTCLGDNMLGQSLKYRLENEGVYIVPMLLKITTSLRDINCEVNFKHRDYYFVSFMDRTQCLGCKGCLDLEPFALEKEVSNFLLKFRNNKPY